MVDPDVVPPGPRDHATVVRLPAEIDATNAGQVLSTLDAAFNDYPIVIADLSATTFCDSSGLTALLKASQTAAARGGELRLAACRPAVTRLLALTGMHDVLHVFAGLAEAGAGTPEGSPEPA
jgi:anti-sigma B factor antagonist